MADKTVKKDFAEWDKDNARTTPLEDFHHADALRRPQRLKEDAIALAEAVKVDKKHMPLRGTGGERFVDRSSPENGTKRPLDQSTQAPSRKSRRVTGQADATQQRPSEEGEASNLSEDPQQPRNSQDAARPYPQRGGRRTGPAEQHEHESKPEVRAQPPMADKQFKGITFHTGAFGVVGPPLKELSKRPQLDAGTPDQFVFEKNLADRKLYARPYDYDNVEKWFDEKQADYKNEDLKWRQLVVYKIVAFTSQGDRHLLDLNGEKIDEEHKLSSHSQALETLITNYKYEEYSEHDDEDLDQRTQQPIAGRKPPMNRFKKLLNARAALFEKWHHTKDDDRNEDARKPGKVTKIERKAAMNRGIVNRNGMPFVDRIVAKNGDEWVTSQYSSKKATAQRDVKMRDAESQDSNAAELHHIAEEQPEDDLFNPEIFAAHRKSIKERLHALDARIKARNTTLRKFQKSEKAFEAVAKEDEIRSKEKS